jgi:hypothetical protein
LEVVQVTLLAHPATPQTLPFSETSKDERRMSKERKSKKKKKK